MNIFEEFKEDRDVKKFVRNVAAKLTDTRVSNTHVEKLSEKEIKARRVAMAGILFLSICIGGCIGVVIGTDDWRFGFFHVVACAFATRAGRWGTVFILILLALMCGYITFVSRRRKNEDERNFEYSDSGTYGTSRMATFDDYGKYFQMEDSAEEINGIILGRSLDNGKVVALPKHTEYNRNIFVCGSQGTKKSVAFSRNLIIQSAIMGESMIITDSKGELFRDTAYYLKMRGYKVLQWNLVNRWNSCGWDILNEAWQDGEPENIEVLVHTIIRNTSDEKNAGDFYDNIELDLLKALCLYVLYEFPEEKRTLGEVYSILQNESLEFIDTRFSALRNLPNGDPHPAKGAYNLFAKSPLSKANAVLGLGTRMAVFSNKAVRLMTGSREINLEDLGREKIALFCIASDSNTTYKVLNALLISMAITKLYAFADSQPSGVLPVSVQMYMDEFLNIGKLDDINIQMGTARGRGIGMTLMVQNIPQFMNRYPDNEWEELIGGCDIRVLLGCNETTTSTYFANYTGTATISVHTERKNLKTMRLTDYTPELAQSKGEGQRTVIMEDEIRGMDRDHMLLFVQGEQRPIKLQKFKYFEHPEAIYMRKVVASESVPSWRVVNGVDIRTGEIIEGKPETLDEMILKAASDDSRLVVQDTERFGPQRTRLKKEMSALRKKYKDHFPNGLPVRPVDMTRSQETEGADTKPEDVCMEKSMSGSMEQADMHMQENGENWKTEKEDRSVEGAPKEESFCNDLPDDVPEDLDPFRGVDIDAFVEQFPEMTPYQEPEAALHLSESGKVVTTDVPPVKEMQSGQGEKEISIPTPEVPEEKNRTVEEKPAETQEKHAQMELSDILKNIKQE